MRKNNCEVIRQELDELMLDEPGSAVALAHLKECAACREFQEQQTRLRRIVGGLGIVSAPADFDFRLRARLANDSNSAVYAYWSFARRGFALAGVLIVFAIGTFYVRSVLVQPPASVPEVANNQQPQAPQPPPPQVDSSPAAAASPDLVVVGAPLKQPRVKKERSTQIASRTRRPLVAEDFSSLGAEVLNGREPAGISAAFPLDVSLESFKVSLDDGRGNARTISVPAISFGSQRVLQTGNQFASKRVW